MRDLKSTTASRICYIYLRNWMLNFDRVTCNTTASNCGSLFGRFYGLVDSILIFKRKKKKEKRKKKSNDCILSSFRPNAHVLVIPSLQLIIDIVWEGALVPFCMVIFNAK